ncbi:hypothetical protein Rhow_003794 [Rhodococcus wratislaviensis]|uniref:NTP pyrophosphohydrolase MazG putative catalytic core domain-containing protein n=1 Tax=Rhodococcus wratislaviensis TaxID=44752 RepID=A0A402C975_RHOWR|nr:hypothetical protein Rhow_003794 [Rhodococcus wratislaviensis]
MRNDNTIEVHRKLVRDNIPDVIRANGGTPHWRALVDDSDYLAAVHAKVVEEARELRGASPEERVDELADLLEVTTALMAALDHRRGSNASSRPQTRRPRWLRTENLARARRTR